MCAYGLGPKDEDNSGQFYRHRTGIAFPRHPGFRAALFRLCPGLSANHRHTALKGSREGTTVSRCTEAGVYAPAFVQAVVTALQTLFVVGGGPVFRQPQSSSRAGGREEEEERARSRTPNREVRERTVEEEGPESDDAEDQSPSEGSANIRQGAEEGEEGSPISTDPSVRAWVTNTFRELTRPDDPASPEEGEGEEGQGPEDFEGTSAPVFDAFQGRRPEGETAGAGTEEEEIREEAAEDIPEADADVPEAGVEDAGQEAEAEEVGSEGELAVDEVGGDQWRIDPDRGLLIVEHNVPRHRLIVPDGPGSPFEGAQFRSERWTRCWQFDGNDPQAISTISDDWRFNGSLPGPYPVWTGESIFIFQGHSLTGDDPWADQEVPGPGAQHGPEPEPSPGECEQDGGQRAQAEDETGGVGEAGSEDVEGSTRAGGSLWVDFEREKLSKGVQEAAFHYVQTIDAIEDQDPSTWRRVTAAGDHLLYEAGTVENAAKALWIAREKLDRNNLSGVDDPELDDMLHPDHLAYLRDVREQGMPARYLGERDRVQTNPHPRARANMSQVYKQLMKDIALHRVLVVDADHPNLGHAVSSPFEAVPKMLPNRTLSADVRVVHDQRRINAGTHKELHPPAVQPLHQQIVRRILWLKARYPGVPILMAKKDVAGAFRLLWLDPRDVELFGGEVPWEPGHMGGGSDTKKQQGDPKALTMLYLVSSFGFSGSPGEWNVWGRATEEVHRACCPEQPRRDGSVHFDGKILVDDMVLVEPQLGLRPWVSSEVYEGAVTKLLGKKAVNALKDAEEGQFADSQIVWGLSINAQTEKMSLPEARVLKGAYLLNGSDFNYGEKGLTLKDLQRFRGIATGWATIVVGLKNELKAADVFLGGVDGGASIRPGKHVKTEGQEIEAWEDLWALFEDCRWLCARSETWAEKFGGDIRELLPAMERLSLPGQMKVAAVFVSSDATLDVLGAIDWTNGLACREELEQLKPWIRRVLEAEGIQEDQKIAIHIGEMLSFVAFACKVGPAWTGKIVIYGGDNKIVYNWITSRKSGVRAGRLLIRVLNLVEMRFRCQVLGGWWRTFHNEDADAITRLDREGAVRLMKQKKWKEVDIKESICKSLGRH